MHAPAAIVPRGESATRGAAPRVAPRSEDNSAAPGLASRLVDHPVLGRLPEAQSVTIWFEDQPVTARAGEAVIAALLASGVRVLRTMPRSGEARGGYCLVGRCPDCLVEVDGQPNVRACVTPVRAGMRVRRQLGLGSSAAASDGDASDSGAPA